MPIVSDDEACGLNLVGDIRAKDGEREREQQLRIHVCVQGLVFFHQRMKDDMLGVLVPRL